MNHCPIKLGKKGLSFLRYNERGVHLAQRRAYERTDDFKNKYRFRAGVEATMSQIDRRTGIKHLQVRGIKAVRFAATMKATALNIIRAAAYKKRRNKGSKPLPSHPLYPHLFHYKQDFLFTFQIQHG
ncbi:transposase [Desulfobulbus sp. US4]|nr:transposase [Desulfobulbus sp. US4]